MGAQVDDRRPPAQAEGPHEDAGVGQRPGPDQRVQVQRVELKNKLSKDLALEQRLGEVRQGVAKGFTQIDELTESATNLVESTLLPIEERLPISVTQFTTRAREQAREVRTQIRQRVSA